METLSCQAGKLEAMGSRLSLLLDLASLLSREIDLDALLRASCERMAEALSADRASIWLVDSEKGDLFTRVALLPEKKGLRQPISKGLVGHVARTGEVTRLDDVTADPRFDPRTDRETGYKTRSMLAAPIRASRRGPIRGVVQLLNHTSGAFAEADERYLVVLAQQLAEALSLTTLRARDEKEPGVTPRGPFNRIIGTSLAMRKVYDRITRAASRDVTVLLRGETGTGKGLFAKAIHCNSKRQSGPFVTVDCTTLPSQLAESELFGHERGAFTGADRRVPGKVELAEGGTLFIDEIGELPLELQGKLLRFLQDRVFERVGGRETLRADVRLVAATHRDLAALVREKKFREDLYFRVRVAEIELPPLRERGEEEIVSLAEHFARIYAERYEVEERTFAPSALALLRHHRFPGNVRELEHWVESAVALGDGPEIDASLFPRPELLDERREASDAVSVPFGLTLEEVEKRYVEATIARFGGNKTEAAKELGIGRNTIGRLVSRPKSG